MSDTITLSAIKPPDETWLKHKAVWDACFAVGIPIPPETMEFFDGKTPRDEGVEIFLSFLNHDPQHECVESTECRNGYRKLIDLTKLPKDTRYIEVKWT